MKTWQKHLVDEQINCDPPSGLDEIGMMKRLNYTEISFPNSQSRVLHIQPSQAYRTALQVQVLARDLERWIKEYRAYLNGADALVGALKWWLVFENPNQKREITTWDAYFTHIENVSIKIFPFLEQQIVLKCVQPLEVSPSSHVVLTV